MASSFQCYWFVCPMPFWWFIFLWDFFSENLYNFFFIPNASKFHDDMPFPFLINPSGICQIVDHLGKSSNFFSIFSLPFLFSYLYILLSGRVLQLYLRNFKCLKCRCSRNVPVLKAWIISVNTMLFLYSVRFSLVSIPCKTKTFLSDSWSLVPYFLWNMSSNR